MDIRAAIILRMPELALIVTLLQLRNQRSPYKRSVTRPIINDSDRVF